jgi:pectate lyase
MTNARLCIICLLLAVTSAQAFDAVNVNIEGSETKGGAAFGFGVTMTWNNYVAGSGTMSNLLDSGGAATSVSINPNATSSYSTSTFFSSLTYGQSIMNGYLFVQNTTKNMTIAGLTAGSTYDLYLYGHGDQEAQNTRFTVNGTSKTTSTNVSGLTALTENAHYVVFKGVAVNTSGQITVNWGNTSGYGALNGIQIIRGNLGTTAAFPVPSGGQYMISSPTTLSWTNPSPLNGAYSITCTVYLGTTSNRTSMDSKTLAANASSVQINTANFPNFGSLPRGTDYYWIVDCVDSSPGANPTNGKGETWMFHNHLANWDGYGGQTTGGAGGTTVNVTDFTSFKNYAESTNPYIIRISGTIGVAGDVAQCKPSKTIEGVDRNATVIGNLQLGSNTIVRNLNITNPYRDPVTNAGSDALTVWGVTNVFVTHCSIYDAYDGLCDITQSSNNVTVSWCKFYYTDPSQSHRFTMISGNDPTSNPHITLHHNWWAQNCDQRMPSGSWNTVHMYNNYFTCTGNYYCSNVRDGGQLLIENSYYSQVNNPVSISAPQPGNLNGLCKTVGNAYISCTGTIDDGADTVFTPPYVYTLDPTANVPTLVSTWAGNTNDSTAPTPNPMTFATAPHAVGASSISMAATTANDISGVQYLFTCTAGGGHSSAWQDSPSYTDTGLAASTSYTYNVQASDKSPYQNTGTASTPQSATTLADTTAPTPNPMIFATAPYATSPNSITMVATTASDDASGVEYMFTCTAGGGHSSGWQNGTTYSDTGIAPSTTCTYTVTARDTSPATNTTLASTPMQATTLAGPDITAPTPNPSTWLVAPYAVDSQSIEMTATPAADDRGGPVQYLFTCTSGGGHDSGWQSSPLYLDTGLAEGVTYTYTVQARDTSANLNTTAASAPASATPLNRCRMLQARRVSL